MPEMHVHFMRKETSPGMDITTDLTSTPFVVGEKISDPQQPNNIRRVFFNLVRRFLSYPKYQNGKNKFRND